VWPAGDVMHMHAGAIFDEDDMAKWQKTLDLDLRATLVGVHLAARAMISRREPGIIVTLASAAGVYPHHTAPVYSAAKAALMHFTKCAAPALKRHGIHIAAVCPQFVDTPLVAALPEDFRQGIARSFGGLLSPQAIVAEIARVAIDRSRSGAAAVILQNGRKFDWDPHVTAPRARRPTMPQAAGSTNLLAERLPAALAVSYEALLVRRLSPRFAEATEVVTLQMPHSVLIKRLVSGINASDVNFTSGKYHGSQKAAEAELPFVAGFESVGLVCKAGKASGIFRSTTSTVSLPCKGTLECSAQILVAVCCTVRAGHSAGLAVGQPVATLTYGGFSEYALEKARFVVPVPAPTPETVAFLTSGLTASISLEQAGLKRGETALVTAAAGGTGLFAVQIAKIAGLHVIGTCGSEEKAQVLRGLGVDRVVNYKVEDLKQVRVQRCRALH
jgi:NAD(P)-dependent dehydrogenase (short-subunit alcohol dehydrogenase family)